MRKFYHFYPFSLFPTSARVWSRVFEKKGGYWKNPFMLWRTASLARRLRGKSPSACRVPGPLECQFLIKTLLWNKYLCQERFLAPTWLVDAFKFRWLSWVFATQERKKERKKVFSPSSVQWLRWVFAPKERKKENLGPGFMRQCPVRMAFAPGDQSTWLPHTICEHSSILGRVTLRQCGGYCQQDACQPELFLLPDSTSAIIRDSFLGPTWLVGCVPPTWASD